MAVKDTIQSIKNNVANAYSKLQGKGATIPTNKNIENLASTIDTVTSGGVTPTGTLLVQQNGVYDVVDYANVDVQVETPTTPVEPPVLTIKNITENGTYYASDDDADGYSSVVVSVEGEEDLSAELNEQEEAISELETIANSLSDIETPNPIIATTDEEMSALLVEDNTGKVVKFTGTAGTYETDTYYLIEGV